MANRVKRHLAHALRRTARKLIGWSNRLDGPRTFGSEPIFVGTHVVEMTAANGVPENAYLTIAPPGTVTSLDVFSAPTLGVNFVEPWAVVTDD